MSPIHFQYSVWHWGTHGMRWDMFDPLLNHHHKTKTQQQPFCEGTGQLRTYSGLWTGNQYTSLPPRTRWWAAKVSRSAKMSLRWYAMETGTWLSPKLRGRRVGPQMKLGPTLFRGRHTRWNVIASSSLGGTLLRCTMVMEWIQRVLWNWVSAGTHAKKKKKISAIATQKSVH